MRSSTLASAALIASMLGIVPAARQVLGPCGAPGESAAAPEAAPAATPANTSASAGLIVQPIPLPGQRALDFKLAAVVDGDIKMVKLSDYDGKWRVVCFYPADFTFV